MPASTKRNQRNRARRCGVVGDHHRQREIIHAETNKLRSHTPAGRSHESCVQRRRHRAERAGERGKFQAFEKRPCAEAEDECGDGRIKLGETHRPQKHFADRSEREGKCCAIDADPVEVVP